MTLVIQFNDMSWDGPMSLHEMFEEQDEKILRLVPDYSINLISPKAMTDEDFTKFHSTLGEVLSFIKYRKDPDKLQEMLDKRPGFHSMGRDEVDVLNACVNAGLVMEESEVSLDVCEAIQIMKDRSVAEGKMEQAKETAITLAGMGMPADKIAEAVKVSLKMVQEWISGSVSLAK